jgi:hypothetical protein
VAGCCEHGNDLSDSLRGGEFLESLSDYEFLQSDCTACSYMVTWGLLLCVSNNPECVML